MGKAVRSIIFFVCVMHLVESFNLIVAKIFYYAQTAFLDDRGLRNNSVKVRSRVAYLFLRFVKSTK